MHGGWIAWGVVAAVVCCGLAVLVRTRWLQSRTLEKCVALSVVIHALLAVVCAFVGGAGLPASWGSRDDGPLTMQVVVDDASEPAPADEPTPPDDAEPTADDPAETASDVPATATPAPRAPADLVPLLEAEAEQTVAETKAVGEPADPVADAPPAHRVPETYADRMGERRAAAAAARGGSVETERAVQAALAWLAAAQADDGRWDAARHGAGRGGNAGGQHHSAVGARSDHGVTGLAMLAFLGAGSTHRGGPHAAQVEAGLRFLLARQRADGSLAGDAEFFAALYCHGMATLALAECCAITGDAGLRQALDRAVRHTLSLQHPATGGWRYAPGDRGDTSQLGWQVMLLASAGQAGITGLEAAEARARTFLQSVSSGASGGLASYRQGERATAAMTAEALVCRFFLGMPIDHPAAAEAVGLLARSPPDRSRPNIYAWYYTTMALFHAGGDAWNWWNAEMQAALLPAQRADGGPLAGSWDPDPVWGGHGGRVYATALSALTLEVYYRHHPLHRQRGPLAAAP